MVCGHSRKIEHYYWPKIFTNDHLFTVIMVLLCASSHSSSLGLDKPGMDCSVFNKCKTCTKQSFCSWSLEKQSCVNSNQTSGSLMVHNEVICPQISVVQKWTFKNELFVYKVKISNDKIHFIEWLETSKIICCLDYCKYKGSIVNGEIKCEPTRQAVTSKYPKILQKHYYVTINNARLKFDNDSDYYFTVYDRSCENGANDYCASCLWNVNNFGYYTKWCSSNNNCTGYYEYNNKVDVNDPKKLFSSMDDNLEIKDCPDMKIQSVEPQSGPWFGGTTVNVTVKNHRILAENKKLTVTVAGRNCLEPKTIDEETITCVTSAAANGNDNGPERDAVKVVYASLTNFTLKATRAFKFVEPEITKFSPVGGPLKGGTLLNISGTFLNATGGVRVFVGENITCETISLGPSSITCLTGVSGVPATGRVRVEFDGSLSKSVQSPVFTYADEPTLDAGQSLGGIASGGTAVPVRGNNLCSITNPTLYVDDRNGARHFTGCRVTNDTYMVCRSPKLDVPSAEKDASPTTLRFGFQMDFLDRVLHLLPQPDFPNFSVYPDPVFADYERSDDYVAINGFGLDRGYPIDDMAVRFQNSSDDCIVILITRRRILCEPTSTDVFDHMTGVEVAVGNDFRCYVPKKSNDSRGDSTDMASVVCAIVVVSVVLIIVVVTMLLLCFKKRNRRDNAPNCHTLAELHLLD